MKAILSNMLAEGGKEVDGMTESDVETKATKTERAAGQTEYETTSP